MNEKMNRRRFCGYAGAAGAGLSAGMLGGFAAEEKTAGETEVTSEGSPIRNFSRDMEYRELGNTGIKVSVFSLGTGKCETDLLKAGLDMGINLMHVSTEYMFGKSIKRVAEAIKNKKEKVHIALKDNFDTIEEALKILGLPSVDFVMFNRHNAEDLRSELPEIKKRYLQWKEKGLVRFAGLTCHKQMAGCLDAAVASDIFACVMPSLSPEVFMELKNQRDALRAKKISIIAMKSKGELKDETYPDQIRKVLSDPGVATINKGIRSQEDLKNWSAAAAGIKTGFLHRRLVPYSGCRLCGLCEAVCPAGVATADLVRCVRYYRDAEKSPDVAAETFHELNLAASLANCTDCGSCEAACPQGIPVRRELDRARKFWTNSRPA